MRDKHALSYGTSALLLLTGAFTASTGLLSDALDLNEFVYHKYVGYIAAALAALHVYLHGARLIAYVRGLVQRKPRAEPARAVAPRDVSTSPKHNHPKPALTRRGFLAIALGSVGGFLLGRTTAPTGTAVIQPGSDIGEVYHRWSKGDLFNILGTVLHWGRQPPLFKDYAWAAKISLPAAHGARGLSLEETIERRRSERDYSGKTMTLAELSRLLYYSNGINLVVFGHGLRAAPSAGALYPIEIYPVVHNVAGLTSGLYHYSYADHSLEFLQAGDLRQILVNACVGQEFLGQANVVLLLTTIFQRTRWRYQERTYRYVMLEAGHVGQNVYLAATSMGMGACAVGAFFDDDLNRLLGIDSVQEGVVYVMTVGKM